LTWRCRSCRRCPAQRSPGTARIPPPPGAGAAAAGGGGGGGREGTCCCDGGGTGGKRRPGAAPRPLPRALGLSGGGRTQSAAGVAPSCSKAESA
ncbi:hypothetical protein Nmel_018274, partial [Mimus melanotis]